MAFHVDKFELVELQVQSGATATRYFFPDLPKLRSKMVTAIETYFNWQNGALYAPSGNPIVGTGVASTSYIVFYTNGTQDLWRIPYLTANRTEDNTGVPFVRDLFCLRPQNITWDKSYIELSQVPTFATNQSFMIGVYYS